jgi:hypothetical protein
MRMLRAVPFILSLIALAPTASRAVVTVPFLEDFPSNVRGWTANDNAPLVFSATGASDDGTYVTDEFNYFGFTSPFGGGPVIFRATGTENPSGNGFKGNWVDANVDFVSFWVRHDTGQDLTYFVRFATTFNFPGVVFDDDVTVPSGVWTQVVIEIDPNDPLCQLEGVDTCAQGLSDVGNFQIGTNAPDPLPTTDAFFTMDLDKIEILQEVPEPGQALLVAIGAVVMAAARRRRSAA